MKRASLVLCALAAVLVTSSANEALLRPRSMLPPSARKPLPDFKPLEGRFPTDAFKRDDVTGRVSVVNLWYEF